MHVVGWYGELGGASEIEIETETHRPKYGKCFVVEFLKQAGTKGRLLSIYLLAVYCIDPPEQPASHSDSQ